MEVVHVVGARPNFMKAAPVILAMAKDPASFTQVVVHTGQHYDQSMSDAFFEDLGLALPDVNLGVGSGSHGEQIAHVMLKLEPELRSRAPDWVFVYGDVNSSAAGALTAVHLGIMIAHVEAGLRSWDRTMPEEHNRVVVDHLSSALFTPSREAGENLRREGLPDDHLYFVGNAMIDSVRRLLPRAEESEILTELGLRGAGGTIAPYVLATIHRPSNVDIPERLQALVQMMEQVASTAPVIFPVHPRTRRQMGNVAISALERLGVRHLPPLGYIDFLALERHAAVVITDSGGVQEETTYLRVPCLTIRPNTERPITIAQGTNELIPDGPGQVADRALDILSGGRRTHPTAPIEFWDGHAGDRIVEIARTFS